MGSAMHRAVSQFSKGEYAGANQTAGRLRRDRGQRPAAARRRPRRHPSDAPTRSAPKTSYAVNGVISTRSDVDIFSIALPCTTDLTVGRQRHRAAVGAGHQAGRAQRLRAVTVKSELPGVGLHRPQPARLDRHGRLGDRCPGRRHLLPARGRRRQRQPGETRLVGLRQPRPVHADRQAAAPTNDRARRQPTPVAPTVSPPAPRPVRSPAHRLGDLGRQGGRPPRSCAGWPRPARRRPDHEVPRARPAARTPRAASSRTSPRPTSSQAARSLHMTAAEGRATSSCVVASNRRRRLAAVERPPASCKAR